MTDEPNEIACPDLAGFLHRVGLTASARARVIAIDRTLARELESDELDAEGCADLVLEAVDLVANARLPLTFDWSAWGDDVEDLSDWGEDRVE
ncbi:UNVERIFIED_ORG: hypothetical protein J2740_001109 [Rhizobium nepotum]|nr:hypothetical protein [Rhizobium nepotum]